MVATIPTGPGAKGKSYPGPEPKDPKPGPRFTASKTRHGTTAGFSKHNNMGTDPCEACAQAKAAYDYRRRSAPETVIRNRISAKAQTNALRVLKDRHYDEYTELYDHFQLKFLKEAGLQRKYRPYKRPYKRNR